MTKHTILNETEASITKSEDNITLDLVSIISKKKTQMGKAQENASLITMCIHELVIMVSLVGSVRA